MQYGPPHLLMKRKFSLVQTKRQVETFLISGSQVHLKEARPVMCLQNKYQFNPAQYEKQ